MTEMAETHVELNQFPVPRVGPRHSTHVLIKTIIDEKENTPTTSEDTKEYETRQ